MLSLSFSYARSVMQAVRVRRRKRFFSLVSLEGMYSTSPLISSLARPLENAALIHRADSRVFESLIPRRCHKMSELGCGDQARVNKAGRELEAVISPRETEQVTGHLTDGCQLPFPLQTETVLFSSSLLLFNPAA